MEHFTTHIKASQAGSISTSGSCINTGTLFSFFQAKLFNALQADHSRPDVAHLQSADYGFALRFDFWPSGRAVRKRSPAVLILSVQQRFVGLLRDVPDRNVEHIYGKCRHHGQSVFPETRDADVVGADRNA